MDALKLVAWNLRRLRVARGISQDNLAHEAEVDRAYVGNVERAKGNPTIITLEKLAGILNVKMVEFFIEPDPADAPPAPLQGGRRKSAR